MPALKTYQDFLEIGESEKDRIAFILAAINEYKTSDLYKTAVDAELYYNGENPTINKYEKILYDLQGKAHVDMYTANHKIASSFFGFIVDQETSYLLGNGVTFQDNSTKEQLETQSYKFDQQIIKAAQKAIIGGVSYGFWNLDHVEVYSATEFVPLVDEEDGAIKAGIRFWQIDDNKPLRATLFELNGYTDYIKRRGEDMIVLHDKQSYITYSIASQVDEDKGTVIYEFENYPGFPIVALKYNDKMRSEICGKKSTIDALDLASSNMVNNVDEGNLIYWVLTNAGGMDDIDDQKFKERIKTLGVVHTEDGVDAQPHTIEAPFTGTQATIDMLTKRLYTDFQAFDVSSVLAGNQTATAIRAMYVPLDLKVDRFEFQVSRFINNILALVEIEDEPTYTRSQITNKQEEIQSVLMGAQYFDDEYMTKKMLTILGDADMFDEIMDRKAADDLDRFNGSVADDSVDMEDEENELTDTYMSEFGDDVMAMLQGLLDDMGE